MGDSVYELPYGKGYSVYEPRNRSLSSFVKRSLSCALFSGRSHDKRSVMLSSLLGLAVLLHEVLQLEGERAHGLKCRA